MRYFKIEIYQGMTKTSTNEWSDSDLQDFQSLIALKIRAVEKIDFLYSLESKEHNEVELSFMIVKDDYIFVPLLVQTKMKGVYLRFTSITNGELLGFKKRQVQRRQLYKEHLYENPSKNPLEILETFHHKLKYTNI